ncbi:2-phosphosulfolactate phosphatase [Pelobium sp.]|nr:2-phosphosulfolactate phosphatase [Pelobium sp.]MDA9555468.1 2-phosphosulfolactate phosphatase [Pelobium sp.]
MNKRKLEVCFTPALLPIYNISNAIVVVIDIFRATSSICYGIENGAKAIIPVATVDECKSYQSHGYLLAAERDGKVVEGFDFGNSPFAYDKDKVQDKTIVLTTTNGTYAIDESKKTAYQVIIGSFLNLTSVCNYLKSQDKDVFLLCAGWKNKFNLEDTLFAGAVVHHLKNENYFLDDSSISANDLYQIAKDDLTGYTAKTSHSERLKKLGIEADIQFCLNVDITTSIPILEDNKLVKLLLQS